MTHVAAFIFEWLLYGSLYMVITGPLPYIINEQLFHTCFFFFLLSQNLDLYVYKNSIKTSDIGFTAKVGDSNTKFEIWFRKRKPGDTYTLVSMSEDIKQSWTDELSNLLWKQALRNRGTYRNLE
jgi:hypothetical protein